MKNINLNSNINLDSLSVDELWALHENIAIVLSSKIEEEKAQLEGRLRKLGVEASSKRHYPKSRALPLA
jgi:DNA-binding protein H-NS